MGRVRQAAELARLIRRERPDVFHANLAWPLAGKYALMTAAAASVPAVVATVHTFDVPISRRTALLHQAVSAGVDRYLAVCGFIADRLVGQLGVPHRKVRTVLNGIRVHAFANGLNRPDLRAEIAGDANRSIVLTPARLDPLKGHSTLLSAAVRLPDVVLAFAGDGPERDTLAQQAAELGIAERVRFLGFRSDINDLLATCDLVALPPLFDGYPLALMEAMAAGKPVITTSAGGQAEMVRNGETGVVVPPGDPTALADALHLLLTDRALAKRLARAARTQAEREFGAERMVEQVEAVYTDVLASD
jgi:glycosyltransferase involved in cell wall biosynthesis